MKDSLALESQLSREFKMSNCFRDLKGDVVTKVDLPSSKTSRWTPNRKYIVVMAIKHEMVTLEECMNQYKLDAEEVQNWAKAFSAKGVQGLQITRIMERTDVVPIHTSKRGHQ